MGRGMRTFIIVAGVVIVGLALFAPVRIFVGWNRERQDRAKLSQAQQYYDSAQSAIKSGDYDLAGNLLTKARLSAKDSRHPDCETLQARIIQDERQIGPKAQAQREEKRRAEEAAKQANLEAEMARRLEEVARETQARALTQARTMYPAYKLSSEDLADYILRFISATEAGLTFQDHSKMEQELQFRWNKFSMRCNDVERGYKSFKRLSTAVDEFKAAGTAWKKKIDTTNKATELQHEIDMQQHWMNAGWAYKEAMSAMSEGK